MKTRFIVLRSRTVLSASNWLIASPVRCVASRKMPGFSPPNIMWWGSRLEYERLKRRVRYDLEMIKNVGYCNGIENYSRHFEGRPAGEPPFTLLDYFKHSARGDGRGGVTPPPQRGGK